MASVFLITTADKRHHWAKDPTNYGDVEIRHLWKWIENHSELRVQDQRPSAADLEQPDYGVSVSFNPAHIVSIARFPCL